MRKENKTRHLNAVTRDANLANVLEDLSAIKDLMNDQMYDEVRSVVDTARTMDTHHPDYATNLEYLRKVSRIPLDAEDEEISSITDVEKALEASHYGMSDVKTAVIESLAVAKLSGKRNILNNTLLVSEPGVGKTTFAMSLGKATGRPVVRISLGGVEDVEKLLCGFLRTFKGSTVGKIVDGIIKSGSLNPIVILDEIDKVRDSGSLLNLLDASNVNFQDKYLGFPLDISGCTFIATANNYHAIDTALADRFETIVLPGYSIDEKVTILEKYVVPVALKESGLTKKQFKVSREVLHTLASDYEYTSGVRNLEKKINTAIRKAAVEILKGRKSFTLTHKRLTDFFGEPIHSSDYDVEPTVGGATGLAYLNDFMGKTLPFTIMKDKTHTGIRILAEAGNDMINSLTIARTHVSNNAERYGLTDDLIDTGLTAGFTGEGSTPISGPSAGLLFGLTLVSLGRGEAINEGICVTGEISLNGGISAVGGIPSKCKAAALAGYTTVIIPEDCYDAYMNDVEEDVRDSLDAYFVSNLEEAVTIAFDK